MVGWTATGSVEAAVAAIADRIDAVFRYDADRQRFERYSPTAPSVTNSLAMLQVGDGLLVHVSDPAGVEWNRPLLEQPSSIELRLGFNLVTWTGPAMDVAQAIPPIAFTVTGAFTFDAATQAYRSFRPEQPGLLNDLASLEPAQAIWIAATAAAAWVPPAGAPIGDANGHPTAPATEPIDPVSTTSDAWVLGPGCLNLRPAPTTVDTTPITCLAEGTPLDLTGNVSLDADGTPWYAARADGVAGWVYGAFVSIGTDPSVTQGGRGDLFTIPASRASPWHVAGTTTRRIRPSLPPRAGPAELGSASHAMSASLRLSSRTRGCWKSPTSISPRWPSASSGPCPRGGSQCTSRSSSKLTEAPAEQNPDERCFGSACCTDPKPVVSQNSICSPGDAAPPVRGRLEPPKRMEARLGTEDGARRRITDAAEEILLASGVEGESPRTI